MVSVLPSYLFLLQSLKMLLFWILYLLTASLRYDSFLIRTIASNTVRTIPELILVVS